MYIFYFFEAKLKLETAILKGEEESVSIAMILDESWVGNFPQVEGPIKESMDALLAETHRMEVYIENAV